MYVEINIYEDCRDSENMSNPFLKTAKGELICKVFQTFDKNRVL